MKNEVSFLDIFRKGSKTYFYSSLFFPKDVYRDVQVLYAFVRTADDLVDGKNADINKFNLFWEQYWSQGNKPSEDLIIDSFRQLANEKKFEKNWVRAFEESMRMDFEDNKYETLDDTIKYMYGSAEVIGLMMCKIMDVQDKAYPYAQALGRSMQYANFLRDINEDLGLNRQYFAVGELKKCKLKSLKYKDVMEDKDNFGKFISNQQKYYREWLDEGRKGYQYLPKWALRAIKTAEEMYTWTVDEIAANPMVVYEKKVKPSIGRIISTGIKNSI